LRDVGLLSQRYLYCNLAEHRPTAFTYAEQPGDRAAQARMIELAGSAGHVVPSNDALQFQKFPIKGRGAKIR